MSELRLGFPGNEKKVEVPASDGPAPWDLGTQLDVVGGDHPRLEAPLKVSGRARYSYDIRFPNLIYARLLGSPHAHAKVRKLDLSKAKAYPGVLYAEDLTRGGTVRYAGQAVAGLAAISEEVLADALSLIEVDYEVLPHVVSVEAALAKGAPTVKGRGGNAGRARVRGRKKRVEAAHKAADVVVDATYRTQVQTHSCLETHGCVAKWSGDQLTVWASTQGTFSVRRSIARALRIPGKNVRVITEHMGGGFGSKFGADVWDVFCCKAAKATKRPCRLMLDRAEEHLAGNRPDSIQRCKFSAKKDGTLLGAEVRSLGTGGVGGGAGVFNPGIYSFQATYSEHRDVATHASRARAFRAPRHPQGVFALEGMLDELAEKIGIDPLALRLKNDPHPVRQAQWKRGAKEIGWSRRKASGSGTGPLKRGFGLAGARWKHNGRPGSVVLVRISRDGTVEVRNGAQDIGSGARTLMATLVAEELGLQPSQIEVHLGDTRDPVGPASGGSTTSPSIAPPTREAAYEAKKALLAQAARALGVPADEAKGWGLRAGKLTGAKKALPFAKVCALLQTETVEASGRGEGSDFRLPRFAREVAGCQFAEVEVDVELGTVRVLKVVAVQDCGTVVNALTARSQINGAVIQGVSYALFEERLLDPGSGRQLNPGLLGYKILGSLDLPEIVSIPMSVANGITSTGVSSLGEPPAIPTAGAIANAVANAIGARVRSLPITPDKVLAALAAGEEEK
ncbi:MAG: xanthine dehydrogenase family protein molybdopterin-binding subunit [Planctomycetes bacterium]|nr:xanthine dehydrogenase family protein molybdopterin-binding subunit [Planctomycetota bacterium]